MNKIVLLQGQIGKLSSLCLKKITNYVDAAAKQDFDLAERKMNEIKALHQALDFATKMLQQEEKLVKETEANSSQEPIKEEIVKEN